MDRIRSLQVFVRVVELGSFSGAARDLGERQASVSRWVAGLEEELGVQLLERTTRAVNPTEVGTLFYQEATHVLDAWQRACALVQEHEGKVAGRLRVSLPVVFGAKFIAPHVSRFTRDYPGVELELIYTDRYVDLVEDRVDIALRVGRAVDTDYRARHLGATPRLLVASPRFVEEHGPFTSPTDFAGLPCLLHTGLDNKVTWRFEKDGEVVSVPVTGRFGANHSDTLVHLAQDGQGVALLASWLCGSAVEEGSLVALLPEYRAPSAPIQVLYSAGRFPAPRVKAWIDFVQGVVDDVVL